MLSVQRQANQLNEPRQLNNDFPRQQNKMMSIHRQSSYKDEKEPFGPHAHSLKRKSEESKIVPSTDTFHAVRHALATDAASGKVLSSYVLGGRAVCDFCRNNILSGFHVLSKNGVEEEGMDMCVACMAMLQKMNRSSALLLKDGAVEFKPQE